MEHVLFVSKKGKWIFLQQHVDVKLHVKTRHQWKIVFSYKIIRAKIIRAVCFCDCRIEYLRFLKPVYAIGVLRAHSK